MSTNKGNSLGLGGRLINKMTKKRKGKDKHWPMVKEYFDLGIQARRPFERVWIVCMAFLVGKQYMYFNRGAHVLQELKRVKGRVRSVDNQLAWRWKRQVADLIRTDPIMSVVPETTEDADIKAAKVGDRVLKAFHQSNRMRRKIRQLGGWIFATGNAFLDDRWNPKLGPIVENPDTKELEYAGDADCGVWGPFDILVPYTTMGQVELHEFPWLIKHKYRSLDWIKMQYPKRGGEVKAESIPYPQTDLNAMVGRFVGETTMKMPVAAVIDFYLQPNGDFPKGLFITAANGVILQKDDYPFNHYHLEHFKDMDIPGCFWGKATEEDAIGLQKSWNRTVSSIDEFNRIIAKGKGLVPRGSKLEVMPDDKHGQWLQYTPVLGHKPEFMTHKGLPQTLLWSIELGKQSFADHYSQHEPTKGTNRSDMRSGSMVAFLREQDAQGSVPTHAVFEEAYEAVMSRVLKRIQTGYTVERTLKIKGDEGDYDVFAFKGADLRNNTDVSVKRDSTIPESRTEREGIVLTRYEKGLYGDPTDPKVRRMVMRMLDDAVTKDIFNETRLDETYARWENQVLFEGSTDVYLVNIYDNHAVHLEEHTKFQKSMEYQKTRVDEPDRFMKLEAAMLDHTQVHQQFLAEQNAAAMKQRAEFERMSKGGEK